MNIFQKNSVMIVFLKSGASKKNRQNIINFINKINGIKKTKYYANKSSMEFLSKRLKNLKSVLKNINPKAMPSFIKIRFKKSAVSAIFLSNIYLRLTSLKGIKLVYYNKMLENKIIQFMFFTKVIGFILFLFLLILSVFISYSAIKLIILRKQNEIEILRLIGATDGYIRIPMFIEGEIGTVLAFLVSISLLYSIYKIFIFYGFDGFLNFFHIKIIFLNAVQIAAVFLIALISGIAGTYLSSRKFF
jgi:cell division transport system permease protein